MPRLSDSNMLFSTPSTPSRSVCDSVTCASVSPFSALARNHHFGSYRHLVFSTNFSFTFSHD